MRLRIILACLEPVLLLGAATACGPAAATSSKLGVVASTNVYGDMVQQIGGSHVSVTSILSDPNADPHLYEPGTQNGLAVAKARLVIQNGLGYDAFMQRLEDASPSKQRLVVTVADVLGVHGKDANPHLWYDVPRLGTIAGAIASGLERSDPAHAAAYRSGLRRFETSLGPLKREVARIKTSFGGKPVAYTEPVPGYLLAAAGLDNLAPDTLHPLDRERNRADAAGGLRHERADDRPPGQGAALQQPGRLADHEADPRARPARPGSP